METMITRWGHSAGIRLPAVLMKTMGLSTGDTVALRLLDSGDIRIRPLNRRKVIPAEAMPHKPSTDISDEKPW